MRWLACLEMGGIGGLGLFRRDGEGEEGGGSPCVRECLSCVELSAGDEKVESLDGSQGKGRLVGEKTNMAEQSFWN